MGRNRAFSTPATWLLVGWITIASAPIAFADEPQPDRTEQHVALVRGDFPFFRYVPGQPEFAAHPRAVIIFGSGDGGFIGWEDRVCRHLQASGFEVLGFDCAIYAKTDYYPDVLQADMGRLARSSLDHYSPPPPVILGGWSMGAAQAVAAAGGPHRPKGLIGLLLISPGDRGRYGLRGPDRWDVSPKGKGTFALADFGRCLDGLRVVQWNADYDILGSDTWLKTLTATHQGNNYSGGMHDYNGACDDFLARLDLSLTWILMPGQKSAPEPPPAK